MAVRTHADVVAGISAAISAYCQALDDGRTADIVDTFCADGVVDIPGLGVSEGRDALFDAYSKVVPQRPQRHVIVNTLLTEWSDREANAVSDLVVVTKGDSGWTIGVVGRYHDTLRTEDGVWRFSHRKLTFL